MIVYAAVPDDTRQVRPGEAFDRDAVAAYLRDSLASHPARSRIAGLDLTASLDVSQFPGGHSNLTYLLRLGRAEFVLRRPPLGPLAPKAHDMAREFRWLAAIHPVFPLAPEPLLLCEDPSVVGATFYVMERRRGLVVRQQEPAEIATPLARTRASEAVVDALVALHAIDVSTPAIAVLGKPEGFVARQVRGWTERWDRSKTSEIAEMDGLATWLSERVPPDPGRFAIVHGDYKLDNVMFDAADAGRLVAVFDWEMTALGDPMVDLGIFLTYWSPSTEPSRSGAADALTTVTNRPGWLSRDAVLDRYAQRSGRDVSGIRFFEVFARFKIAVVIQQIYRRFVNGQTDDERFARFGERVISLAQQAERLAAG